MTSNLKQARVWRWADLLFCLLVAIVLYLRFFRLPNLPIDPALDDQPIFLWGATKILDGQVIYRDFLQFTTPGTEYLYAILIKLFGHTALMPKLVAWAVGVAFTVVGVSVSRYLLSGWRIYLPSLLFLTAGFLPIPDATHHVFSTLAVLAGLLFLLPVVSAPAAATWRLFAAGLCCGLSFCFTPMRGVLAAAAFVAFLCISSSERKLRVCYVISAGFLLPTLVLLVTVTRMAGVHNVFECLVWYPMHNYRASPWNNLAAYAADLPVQAVTNLPGVRAYFRWLLVYLVCPWVFLFVVMRLCKPASGADELQVKRTALVTIVGVALFLSIAYAPTHFRMGIISLPAFILLVWLLGSEKQAVCRVLLATLAVFACVTVPAGILHSQGDSSVMLNTPSGQVVLSPAVAEVSAEKYRWLSQHTHPGDFLFTPDYLDYDYLFQLKHPGPTATLWVNDYSTREQVQQTVDAMEHERVQYAIWPMDFQSVVAGAHEDRLTPIRDLLRQKYVVVHRFSDADEVWKRKSD